MKKYASFFALKNKQQNHDFSFSSYSTLYVVID